MTGLAWLGRHPGALRLTSALCQVNDKRLVVKRFGLTFPNPVGLAAGLDKNARAVPSWAALGFGFAEVGSITAQAQAGNSKPRLFRLPEDKALINRMGFNNEGAELIAKRLEHLKETYGKLSIPLGINLGKSKGASLADAPADYQRSLELLYPFADYVVINVSSPNTPGLRELQAREQLADLLGTLQGYVRARGNKPVLLKIAPDLSWSQVDDILALALEHNIAGIIATNTTISRDGLSQAFDEPGGLSGQPLKRHSLEFLHYLRRQLGTRLPIISVGGVANAEDVYTRLKLGASLVQLYTAFIYEGPLLLRTINQSLLRRLEQDGLPNLEAAIGTEAEGR